MAGAYSSIPRRYWVLALVVLLLLLIVVDAQLSPNLYYASYIKKRRRRTSLIDECGQPRGLADADGTYPPYYWDFHDHLFSSSSPYYRPTTSEVPESIFDPGMI